MAERLLQDGFDTRPLALQPLWKVTYQAPSEDIDRIFERIVEEVPLVQGNTDRNAYRAPPGQEYYRPREGTPTGAEEETRKRPGVEEMSFFLPRESALLDRVVEAIYQVHSYYEPVIVVQEVLRSQSKGLDDRDNPHRWWNKQGDWKTGDDGGA